MPANRTIPAVLAHAVTAYGDLEAVVDGDVRWTFAEFGEQVYRCAAAMIASGVQPGDRVAIWAPNSHRFMVAALGTVTAGAVFVPVNTRYKGDEASWILGKSGARLLVVENGFLGNDYVTMLKDTDLPELVETVRLDGGGELSWEEFLRRGEAVNRATVLARAGEVNGEDLSDMFFTSGTTGRPKGAMTTHAQNLRVYDAWIAGTGLQRGDRYLIVNPMFHCFGYKAGVLVSLMQGATVLPQATFDVEQTLELIHREKVTVLPGPPTLYASLLEHPRRAEVDLSSLRLAITGASVVPVALVERMRAEVFPSVVIAYGLTESCGTATVGDPNADSETISRTVGKAIEGTEVIVADAEGAPVPTGESGEVCIRGYNVMQGYFDDPEATAAAIDAGGWLHTGDVGILDEQGNLRITDRVKDMFVVGGFNAYPAEIEQAITRHDKVSEAAVIGIPDERLGEVGRAYVIPRHGETISEDEIVAYCREKLANFKVPRSVVIVDELPRNASGKVLKFVLRDQEKNADA